MPKAFHNRLAGSSPLTSTKNTVHPEGGPCFLRGGSGFMAIRLNYDLNRLNSPHVVWAVFWFPNRKIFPLARRPYPLHTFEKQLFAADVPKIHIL